MTQCHQRPSFRPMCALTQRRYLAPRIVSLVWLAAHAAWTRTDRSQQLLSSSGRSSALRLLWLFPGLIPAHRHKWPAVANRVMSVPTSAMITSASDTIHARDRLQSLHSRDENGADHGDDLPAQPCGSPVLQVTDLVEQFSQLETMMVQDLSPARPPATPRFCSASDLAPTRPVLWGHPPPGSRLRASIGPETPRGYPRRH